MNMKLRSFEKLPMEILFNHIPPARLTVWLINAHIIVYSRNCIIRLDVWFVVLIYCMLPVEIHSRWLKNDVSISD